MRSRTSGALAMSIAAGLALLGPAASPALAAPCTQGDIGALPVVLNGAIKVRPYESTNIISSPAAARQKNCLFLENVGGSTIAASVDHQIEEPGSGMPGPWEIVAVSSINISGGDPVTCSMTSGEVAHTTATFGLAPGAISDICCFTWEAGFPGTCDELPGPGDIVNHSMGPAIEENMPILSYIPVGGTTCGLVGIELVWVVPLLRMARRRARSRS